MAPWSCTNGYESQPTKLALPIISRDQTAQKEKATKKKHNHATEPFINSVEYREGYIFQGDTRDIYAQCENIGIHSIMTIILIVVHCYYRYKSSTRKEGRPSSSPDNDENESGFSAQNPTAPDVGPSSGVHLFTVRPLLFCRAWQLARQRQQQKQAANSKPTPPHASLRTTPLP